MARDREWNEESYLDSSSEHSRPSISYQYYVNVHHTEKDRVTELETIHTNERVGTHALYYEKGGLRTEGDGVDHDAAHHKLTFRKWMALTALAFMWTGSQIPVYLFGGIAPDIYAALGGVDRWIWFVLGNLLALASICPFVGALSDLFGRRYVALIGSGLILTGMVICSTAKNMNIFIAGMTIAGGGAGVNELTALAGTSELAPTRKRGQYVALMVFTILPFAPSVVWAQLINSASSFRYVGLFCGLWAFVGFVLTLCFYFPPPRPNSAGYTKRQILARVDYVGGVLSISGFLLVMMGFEWAGYQYAWDSPHVLGTLIPGGVLLIAFCLWEKYGAKYPMVPGRLKQNPRILLLTLVITFISGANFFSLLFFWPTAAFNMYGNDPVGIGVRSLPLGFGILTGAIIVLWLIGVTGGKVRLLMVVSSVLMTAGTGACSIATPDNLYVMYGLVFLGSLGIGGIVVPAQVVTTIVCPDDLIGTITALTLSIRVLGGAIGFTTYYNVFYNKLVPAMRNVVGINAIAFQLGFTNRPAIVKMVHLVAHAQFAELRAFIDSTHQTTPYFYNVIVTASQWAFADAYKWVYWISIAFGCVSIICAMFLGDISKYMDDQVAVIIE